VACVLNDVLLNIGHLIVNEFREFEMHDSLSLVFPSMIMELCKRVEVEILLSDTWMEPKILSIHLRYVVRSRGEKQKEEDGLR